MGVLKLESKNCNFCVSEVRLLICFGCVKVIFYCVELFTIWRVFFVRKRFG
jgi:hypothetical protein